MWAGGRMGNGGIDQKQFSQFLSYRGQTLPKANGRTTPCSVGEAASLEPLRAIHPALLATIRGHTCQVRALMTCVSCELSYTDSPKCQCSEARQCFCSLQATWHSPVGEFLPSSWPLWQLLYSLRLLLRHLVPVPAFSHQGLHGWCMVDPWALHSPLPRPDSESFSKQKDIVYNAFTQSLPGSKTLTYHYPHGFLVNPDTQNKLTSK